MKTVLLKETKEIIALEHEWENLLERAANRSVFMTWDWLVTWWEVFGKDRELWWLLVRDEGGKLIGGAPLCMRRGRMGLALKHRELRWIGTGAPVSPEHLDIVAAADRRIEVGREMARFLAERFADWDVLILQDITDSAALAYGLAHQLTEGGAACSIQDQFPRVPVISLPPSYGDYFRSLSSRMRAQLARHRRKTSRELGVRFRIWSESGQGLPAALQNFERVFAARKESVGIGNKFEKVRGYREFHYRLCSRLAKKGWLYLAFLENSQHTFAAEYNFKYGGTLSSYQFGFDPTFAKNNVFKVLRSLVIQDAIEQGLQEFDLLRGEEPYKCDWGAVARDKKTLRLFSPNFYGRTVEGISKLRRMGKRLLEKAGMSQP